MTNQAILEHNSKFLAVQINPAAYRFRAFSGKPSEKAILAFDVNYSWLIAIGHVRSENHTWKLTIPLKKDVRPCLCIKDNGLASIRKPSHPDFDINNYSLVMQGGPSLVANKRNVFQAAKVQEDFKDDAVRRTDHVVVGTTKLSKIIVIFGRNVTMKELADELIRLGAINAMKCDGGSRSYLYTKDSSGKITKVGNAASCRVGVQFEIK